MAKYGEADPTRNENARWASLGQSPIILADAAGTIRGALVGRIHRTVTIDCHHGTIRTNSA